ncbi:Calmodulin-binding protein 60 G [Cardamine amara subsp. amara]|uniref:Calmodulin-binding protein 60 G n=1 Tax=Cardamine amara subsp. amara TaxID=228776 RepID=A0ABD1B7F9_CARAN
MKIRNGPFHGAGGYSGLGARNLTFKKVVKQVMKDRSNNQFLVQMENMLRRIVQEELDRRLQPFISSLWGPMERSRSETPSSRPRYKLRFVNSPKLSIFTGAKIEADDDSPLVIELVDTTTNARAVSGQLSSSRVEIVPLNADFTEESWTAEIFKRNILKQREGKRPLLTGDLTVTLQNGVGVIAGDVAFSDNSSWTRSRKFRLGARLTGGGAVEARSQAFGCKDQRGESYQKHDPPYPGDEVWRLEKIAKDGVSAKRLGAQKIYTVKEFRRWYTIDPIGLYNIMGNAVSKRTWESIVSHAMRCVLAETECYIYNSNAYNGASLLFNSFYEMIKVSLSVGGPYQNVHELTNYQPFVDQLKLEAYQNVSQFRLVDARDFENHPQRSLQCPQNPGFGMSCPGTQHIDFQGASDPSGSSTSLCRTASSSTVHPEMLINLPTATFHIDKKFVENIRNSFKLSELDQVHGELQSVVTRGCIKNINDEEDENALAHHQHYDMYSNWSPGTSHWTQQAIESMFDVRIANMGSPRARWCKVKAALKLQEVLRHTTARNRRKACNKTCLPY